MLVVLGIGPGDSGLITVRGAELLRNADKVFVPGNLAKKIVSPYVEAEVLNFPMTDDTERINQAMEMNCATIAEVARSGTAVLGVLGDPAFYSTYARLWTVMSERYPDIERRLEPGVSSITAFASRLGVAVRSGVLVTDGSEQECLVLLKVKRPREKVDDLRSQGYKEFGLVERMYMDDERTYTEAEMPESCDYMSVMFARK
jgi:precorrin-2/cobalt-factor-2 C20-methyltransferase